MDWTTFTPRERAVIVFARRENEVLLIHKKRGLGAGKVNGPGGRIDPGETPAEAAIRETMEEVSIRVHELQQHATLHFVFTDGYSLTVYVYVTERFSGTAAETEEANPFWCHISEIPYESMWADDAQWLPEVLADRYVDGRFVFEGDSMLSSEVNVRER
ncbi:MAG TPA: 8-oxo-dGTP diphosphatase [Spirochaetia bacterium]|nr:8-oxo-dGTP diphosphatase [Spirochaetia bacterium]